jgi:transketolase
MHSFNNELSKEEIQHLEELSRHCRGDIIKMTSIAGSGHPGGSMSSLEIYLTLFSCANISPDTIDDPQRDRIVISHGHTSPGLYACLARLGFIDVEDVLITFRRIDSPYEGHIEQQVPGIEWTTGNLGQGLSAGCGAALASQLGKYKFNTFVAMSDAEQAKGQVAEARRFARKYNLNDLTVLIDYNHTQISGRTDDIMPVHIKENYCADGWKVIEVSGHKPAEIHRAVKTALGDSENPYVIICNTIIGHGVSFMQGKAEYHGRALTREEYQKALKELKIDDDIDTLLSERKTRKVTAHRRQDSSVPKIIVGEHKVYTETVHPRSVFGNALAEIAQINPKNTIVVFDCDLCDSVKTTKFAKVRPENFFEAGVSEHNTATVAGALSLYGFVTVWADFGVFAIDEVYNQLRLNDINNTNVKIIATHLGFNVGPDGKTHHCIDYLGLLRNLPGFRFVIPGDPNQADHMTRYVLSQPGNWVLGLTRSKLPPVTHENGELFFDSNYSFTYGALDVIRQGADCTIFTMGALLQQAITASEKLKETGIRAGVYNISSPCSIDREKVCNAAKTGLLITYEDHIITSGIGCTISQIIGEERMTADVQKIGITQYGGSDEADVLYKRNALDADSLVQAIKKHPKVHS